MQRLWAALLLELLLAGCAGLPGSKGPDPQPLAPEALTAAETVEFTDLFDRMRSGFALPAVDQVSVRREIEWYREHPAHLERTFGRGRRYLHHIVEMLEQRGLPQELALLPAVESAFDPFALSNCSASGLWQFLPHTGRRYGLDQDWWADDRRDVLEATRAALDHLSALHEDFDGDWLLALAAYNAGAPRVKRAIRRNQLRGLPIDFFALDLPAQTRRYVPRLLAIARLVAEPQAFGLALPELANAPYFARVEVAHQIDLGHIADLAEIPREELRALNPAFERWATPPGGPQELLVPAADKERFERVLATLPPSERLRLVHHRVQRGDTLIGIARRHGIPLEALYTTNRIRDSRIRPGQDLLIPLPYEASVPVARRDAV